MFAVAHLAGALSVLILLLVVLCLFGAAWLLFTRRIVEGAALAIFAVVVGYLFLA